MNGDRNQKATALTVFFYILGVLLSIWGAIIPQEGRIIGTINKRPIDIPVYFQNEPEYKGKIVNAKVTQGWGGGRLILWLLGAGAFGLGIALSAERLRELQEERPMYELELLHRKKKRQLEVSYDLSINQAIKQKEGTARLAIVEDQLLDNIDRIRAENGWVLPEPPATPPAPPVLKNELPPLKSPAEFAAAAIEAAKMKEAIMEGLKKDGDGTTADAKPGDEVPEDARKKEFQDRGKKIARSLASLRMSILSAAPTGAGKTLSLYRYLEDLRALYPENECYVIAHKCDSFLGLYEAGKVTEFDDLNPEASLDYLDKVYAEMRRRLKKPEHERGEFERKPIRLILDDWFASFDVLKNYPEVWRIVKTKIGAIITKGREANVCLYIATQSFNLEALGIQDSNIRGNLAITCQGLVTEKLNDFGELVEQGNYESIQLLIDNKFIVASKLDRDRLNSELDELIALSRLHQVPAIFSAVGRPTVGLVPHYEKPIGGDDSKSTNVALLDRDDDQKDDDSIPQISDAEARRWAMEFDLNQSDNQISDYSEDKPSDPWNDGKSGVSEPDYSNQQSNQPESNQQSNQPENSENMASKDWYKWLPSKSEVLRIMDDLDGEFYNTLTYVVRTKLKKTEAAYSKKAKNAIVQMLIDLDRDDLIEKFNINLSDYPLS